MHNLALRLTLWSCWALALFLFVSNTLSALHHLFLLLPGFYFFWNDRERWKISSSQLSLLVLFGIIVISLFLNLNELDRGFLWHLGKAKYFLFAFLGVYALKALATEFLTPRHIKHLLSAFFLATSLATISGLIALWSGYNPLRFSIACHETRACGMYGMYMTYGYGISLFCVLLVGLFLVRKSLEEYLSERILFFALVVNLAGLFFSYARGGWIGFTLVIPLFFFKVHKKLFFISSLSVIVTSLGIFGLNPKVRETFLDRTTSNQERLSFYQSAAMAVKEKPFFGVGYRNFEPQMISIKERYNVSFPERSGHAHNNFFELFASTGLIGGLLYLFFCLRWIWECYHRDDVLGEVIFPFSVSFSLAGLFQLTIGDGSNAFLVLFVYMLSQLPAVKKTSEDTNI